MAPILQHEFPAAKAAVPACRRNAAVELDVAPQGEFVGDIVEIALGLRPPVSEKLPPT